MSSIELDQLYGEIGALAPRLSEIFSSRDALLRERYAALIADDAEARPAVPRTRSLTADGRRKLRAYVEEHGQGDIVGLATNAAYQISERSDTERQNLRTEYDNIRGGGTSEGDIDPDYEAWLAAVALAATIALGPEGRRRRRGDRPRRRLLRRLVFLSVTERCLALCLTNHRFPRWMCTMLVDLADL